MAVAIALLGASCSKDRGARRWIQKNPAIVKCVVSGPERLQPILAEIPAPPVPTGLFARQLDPMALDALGFTREHVACASLAAPSAEQVAALQAGVEGLARVHGAVDGEARVVGGRCSCEVARAAEVRDLLRHCQGAGRIEECKIDPTDVDRMREVTQPLVDQVASTPVPFRHWRLAGPTDRPGWFVDHLAQLLERHPGGSAVLQPGEPIPERENHRLLSALLGAPGVVAVARQDAGRAVLVVRERGGDLILDHFQYPEIRGPRVKLRTLLDNARAKDYLAALEAVSEDHSFVMGPTEGNLVEVDRLAAERVDEWIAAGSGLWRPYRPNAEVRENPPAYADRVIFQAPFGRDGKVLNMRMILNDDGVAWVSAFPEAPLSSSMDEIGVSPVVPEFIPASGRDPGFIFRGTPLERVLFHSVHASARFMPKLELESPGAIGGTPFAFEFEFPTGPMTQDLETAEGYKDLRARLSRVPYVLRGTVDSKRSAIALQLAPR